MGKGFDPRKPNRQDYYNLLNRALQIIRREKDAKEQQRAVERLLEENLDKLDDEFSQMLRSWARDKLSVVEPEEARRIARNLNNFCNWIAQFPLLKPENKSKIVITGWEVAATVLTCEVSPKEWLTIQNSLGIAYRNQGRIDEAIAIFTAALDIYPPEVFSKRFLDEWAMLQNNLGNAYFRRSEIQEDELEDLDLAIACYEEALRTTPKHKFYEWAQTKQNLCGVYCKQSETAEAITCYETILQEVYTEEEFPYEWAQIQNNLGLVYSDQRNIDKAIDCFRLALKILTPTAYPEDCLITGRGFGYVALNASRWQEAIEGYGVAIEALEQQIRIWAKTDSQRQKTQEAEIDVYIGMVKACINEGQLTKAIEYVERSKARNLVECLASLNLHPKGVSEDIRNELNRLRQEIPARQHLLDKEVELRQSRPNNRELEESDRTQLNQLQQQIDELQEQLNSLITEQIQPHNPSFTLTQQVKGILFQEIQALLSDDKTALIEWYILDDIFVTFIITHQNPGITVWQSCPEDLQALKNWGDEYLQDYGQPCRKDWRNRLKFRLNRLAEILHLDEVLTHVPDTCDQVILVPHRSLHILPLHALPLPEEEDKCLLDKFPRGVKYAPSCQVLQLAQSRQRPDFTNLFAIQNPTEDLNYSDIEVQAIKQHFHTSHILARGDAKKSAIDNQQLQAAHCLHFSCHGYFNFEHPLLSTLHLADCYIPLPEIFTLLDLSQCRLVTLSACETGLTNFTSVSDEYIGLPNGFLVAGASSVVSSLWIVNEVCTALLMIQFYENLHDQQQQGYLNVAIAINKAQTWLRDATKEQLQQWVKQLPNPEHRMQLRACLRQKPPNSKPFESPYHWAAFCAIGQ
jgi:CHAT domain-containing protein